jgi:uncharacterized protein YpmB
MILTLAIVLIVLLIALWISAMLLWWRSEQEKPVKTVGPQDLVRSVNKVVRMGRRSWYGGLRYSKQASLWGNKKARNAFVTLFPQSKSAFVNKDALTGLEHGPSSYFLANLSRPAKKPARTLRKKKVVETEPLSTPDTDLSE